MVNLHPLVWYGGIWELPSGKPLACPVVWFKVKCCPSRYLSLTECSNNHTLMEEAHLLWLLFGHYAHGNDRWHADRSFCSAYWHLVLALPTHKSCQLTDSRASLTSRHFIFQVCSSLLVDHWPEPKLDASSSIVPKLRFLTDGPMWSQD